MHGIVFAELRQYIEARLGKNAWAEVVAETGVPGRLYLVAQQFPDAEFHLLVAAAARRMGLDSARLLEDLGEFVAPDLLKMYAHSIKPEWRTLDVIEHTETAIHQVVRLDSPGANPPRIETRRAGKNEVIVKYASPRKLCAFAKGIARGIAGAYGERVVVTESTCMHRGADCCTVAISVE